MKRKIAVGIMYYLPERLYLSNEFCIPIQLGFHETNIEMGIQKDNEGDNRALKHPIYSEYSGIYWLWKNVNAEYKGILHHRRALTAKKVSFSCRCTTIYHLIKFFLKNIIHYTTLSYADRISCTSYNEYVNMRNDFFKELPQYIEQGYEIIVPKPYHFFGTNILEFFDEVVNRILMNKVKSIIEKEFPDFFPFFNRTIYGNKLYYANMSIMKNAYFEEYNAFIFGVFDRLEKEIVDEGFYINPVKEKSLYRIFGYIGELLTNTYILKKKTEGTKIKELTLLFNEDVVGNEKIDMRKLQM